MKINKIHNVLIVEPCYENFGGYFRAIGISKALAKRKIHVDLLVSSNKKVDFLIRKKCMGPYLIIYTLPRIEVNFFINGRILRGLIASIFILFKKYDIIHLFAIIQFESNIPLILFFKLYGDKIVIDWDDYWSGIHETIVFYNKYKRIIPKYFKYCEYKIQKLSNNATATSSFLIKELQNLGIKNTLKIINCVDIHEFSPIEKNKARSILGFPYKDKLLLIFGNTFFKERTIYLLRFFEKLYKLNSSIKLYINIDPKKLIKENCPKEIFNEKIFHNIINIGHLNKKQLSLYTSATDAILFLTGNSTYEKACFPIRVGTFLNSENVVIMNETDTEACNTLKAFGCAIVDKSIDNLAKKTLYFLNNFEQQKKYKRNVQKAKRILSWDNQIDRLTDFYSELSFIKK